MSYNKHNFKKGDPLPAQSLNEMETQIFENTEEIASQSNKILEQSQQIADLEDKVNSLELGGVSEETVKQSITDYLSKNPPQAYDDTQVKRDIEELKEQLGDNVSAIANLLGGID